MLKAHKIIQSAFAERCRQDKPQMSRWLSGKIKPTRTAMLAMELILDIMIKEIDSKQK